MANDVIVRVSMSVKPKQFETLSRHAAGPALPMKVTDHVRSLAGL
jgi:hypothetical protein